MALYPWNFLFQMVVLAGAGLVAGQDVGFVFDSFNPTDPSLRYSADSSVTSDGELQLTKYAAKSTGHTTYIPEIKLRDTSTNTVASFSTNFTFRIQAQYEKTGEGLAFVMLGSNSSSSYGSGGALLGVYGSDGAQMTGTLAVEFDTFKNDKVGRVDISDISSNHVGLDLEVIQSKIQVDAGTVGIFLADGSTITSWIDYTASTSVIEVRISLDSAARPTNPLLSYKVDLSTVFCGSEYVWIGFSAATGDYCFESHTICNWGFSSWGLPPWYLPVPPPASNSPPSVTPPTPAGPYISPVTPAPSVPNAPNPSPWYGGPLTPPTPPPHSQAPSPSPWHRGPLPPPSPSSWHGGPPTSPPHGTPTPAPTPSHGAPRAPAPSPGSPWNYGGYGGPPATTPSPGAPRAPSPGSPWQNGGYGPVSPSTPPPAAPRAPPYSPWHGFPLPPPAAPPQAPVPAPSPFSPYPNHSSPPAHPNVTPWAVPTGVGCALVAGFGLLVCWRKPWRKPTPPLPPPSPDDCTPPPSPPHEEEEEAIIIEEFSERIC